MNSFPQSLKSWRQTRRLSQLDLALEAEVSARHISFLETGRAKPSRDMIGRLGAAMQLPLDAQNQLLNHAGFAARYPVRQWEDAEMAPIKEAIAYTLESHAPYPAIAVDRLWNIVRMNDPAKMLYAQFGMQEGDSVLDLLLSPDLPAIIENWPAVAHHSARRLRTESAAQGGIPEFEKVAAELSKVPPSGGHTLEPVLPTILNNGEMRLSLFATIAQLGTPEDVTLDALKIELFFPADEPTAQLLRAMANWSA